MKDRILVVDDEKNIILVVQAMLERAGFEVIPLTDGASAIQYVNHGSVCVVVTDLYMHGKSGMDILEYCKREHPALPVVLMTAHGTVETAVLALKKGAFDYITKPFDQTELLNVVRKAAATFHRAIEEPVLIKSGAEGSEESLPISAIIGSHPKMLEIFKLVQKVAKSPSTVLITGESGTGKELVAYEVHRLSAHADGPFIKINCGAIPQNLIESELFGYEKGAFTGAVGSKPGRFELADKGTIFLDEVAEMPLEMQVKLLRVLQEQKFERVGGIETIQVDVRIVTATNKNLEAEVKANRFREDLFYRLNVVPIHIPPLRERREDIDALVQHFIFRFNTKLGKKIDAIEPICQAALRGFAWPGNVRQLENTIERMVVMTEDNVLSATDIPEEITRDIKYDVTPEGATFKAIVREQTRSLERDLIEKALDETGGNVTRAAEKLGLSRKGLQLKMKELGLKRQEDERK